MKILDRIRRKLHSHTIAGRIILVISALMIVTILGFSAALYGIFQTNLTHEQKLTIEKNIDMAMEKLDMFFDEVENDALSVLVSENAQKLLEKNSASSESDIIERHGRYQILRGLLSSYIGQKGTYRNIAFYDLYGNCYVSESLEQDPQNFIEQQKRASDFMSSPEISRLTGLHKSPWRKQNAASFEDCISYFRKIIGKNNGRVIGIIEMEISVPTIVNLYRTVMSSTVSMELSYGRLIIISPDDSRLYHNLADEAWYDAGAVSALSGNDMLTLESRDTWQFLKPYPPQDWLVICHVQKSAYRESLRHYLLLLLALSLLLLCGSVILVRFLVNSITRSIRSMTETVDRIAQGESDLRVETGEVGEIGILGTEINRMLDRIQSLMTENVQKEQLKREAEMSMLQLQMTPHFFYNIMESLVGLIYMDEKKTAVQVIQHLSGFYRGVLNHGKEIISISQELETAVNYLEIMMICHPGLFTYTINCPDSAGSCAICKLTLQPILENAVHHGFQDLREGGHIDIDVSETEENITIDVRDNGKGMSEESRERILIGESEGFKMESFGLRNTDDRLKLYFGEEYGIRIMEARQGTWIRILLPGLSSDS